MNTTVRYCSNIRSLEMECSISNICHLFRKPDVSMMLNSRNAFVHSGLYWFVISSLFGEQQCAPLILDPR